MTVVRGKVYRALLPMNSWPMELMTSTGKHWQHHVTVSEKRKGGHLRQWDSDFIACHNFIPVAVTNYHTEKQLWGKSLFGIWFQGTVHHCKETTAGTQAASHIVWRQEWTENSSSFFSCWLVTTEVAFSTLWQFKTSSWNGANRIQGGPLHLN